MRVWAAVALPLLDPVPRSGLGRRGAILLPVASVVGAPLPSAVAANFAIFRINSELFLATPATALLLARLVRTHGLLGMKSGSFELFLAETAAALIHPFKVTGHPMRTRGTDVADCSALGGDRQDLAASAPSP